MKYDDKSFLSQELLKLLEEYAPDFMYIADYTIGSYIYVSDSVMNCLGYHPELCCSPNGVAFTFSLLHPDDIKQNLELLTKYEDPKLIGKIPSITVEYRIKHADGHYIWMRAKDYIIEFTAEGKIKTALGMALCIDEAKKKEESMFASFDIKSVAKDTYDKYVRMKDEVDKISYRELQVVELLGHGLSSKAISSRLQISEDTVETHRKNILKKLGLNNTVQTVNVINKYKRLG